MKKFLWMFLCCFGNAYAIVSASGISHSWEKNVMAFVLGGVFSFFLYPRN